jgi:hypothetical protein
MLDALQQQLGRDARRHAFAELPAIMTDLLLEHPQMAALFQQALRGDPEDVGVQLLQGWLDRLFSRGMDAVPSHAADEEPAERALLVIAMFNLCTGYFLSQPVFEKLAGGQITDPVNIERQKQLLGKIVRATVGE